MDERKTCPITNKVCYGGCEGEYCWIRRIEDGIIEDTVKFILSEAEKYSKLDNISPDDRVMLADAIAKIVAKKIAKQL